MPQNLKSQWLHKVRPPEGVFYELTGCSADIAQRAFSGEAIPIVEAKEAHLCTPQTQVFMDVDFFRAVSIYPSLFKLNLGEAVGDKFFAHVPVGYNLHHSTPKDAVEITGNEELNLLNMALFANEHCSPPMIDVKHTVETKLPDDFYPETCLFHPSDYDVR